MAVLQKPVALNVVQGFRGVVDFYYWKTLPVVRAWPRKPVPTRTPRLIRTHRALIQAHAWKRSRSLAWHALFLRTSIAPGYCAEDFKRKIALNLSYASQLWTPPDPTLATLAIDPSTKRTTLTVKCPGFHPHVDEPMTLLITRLADDSHAQQWRRAPRPENRYNLTRPYFVPVFENFIEPDTSYFDYITESFVAVFAPELEAASFYFATNDPAKKRLPLAPCLPAPSP